jgi:hypothetical protein
MTKSYEVCVVKDGRVIVYVVEYTKKQAQKYLKQMRIQYPDCDVQVYVQDSEAA